MKGIDERKLQTESLIYEKLVHYPPVLTQYYQYLVNTGKSINTRQQYINSLIHFIEYIFEGAAPHDFYKQINSLHIRSYLNSLSGCGNSQENQSSTAYRATKWSALNSFFQFLTPRYITSNPVERVERPMVEKDKKTEYLTIDEVSIMLNNARESNNERFCNRNLCIMMLGFYCGLRTSAITQANIGDIDWLHNTLRVYESNDDYYDIPMSTSVRTQLSLWLSDRQQIKGADFSEALFLSQQGNRISDDMVLSMLKDYSIGIGKKVNAQIMRNTCIVTLYQKTKDLSLCSKLLNQTNIASVYRYIEKLIPVSSVENAVQLLDDIYGFIPNSK